MLYRLPSMDLNPLTLLHLQFMFVSPIVDYISLWITYMNYESFNMNWSPDAPLNKGPSSYFLIFSPSPSLFRFPGCKFVRQTIPCSKNARHSVFDFFDSTSMRSDYGCNPLYFKKLGSLLKRGVSEISQN